MKQKRRILIFRLGALGDTVVALPAFRLIANAYPDAERVVLTYLSANTKAVPVAQVLEGSGLVHGFMGYSGNALRDPRNVVRLRREVRRFGPDVLVYLAEPRGRLRTLRDAAFFRWCGIPRLVGVPYSQELQLPRQLGVNRFEYEGARLVRCLEKLGSIALDENEAFDLKLSHNERAAAAKALDGLSPQRPIFVVSIGAKVDVKDWGDRNWKALIQALGKRLPGWSLVMIGAYVERARSEALADAWPGKALNLCGDLKVRESAAVLQRARFYLGHDSGPMHLAAAVGVPCVSIFSSRNLPGEWSPYGPYHRVLYTDVPCRGCKLDTCVEYGKKCINSIHVDDVIREVECLLPRITFKSDVRVS